MESSVLIYELYSRIFFKGVESMLLLLSTTDDWVIISKKKLLRVHIGLLQAHPSCSASSKKTHPYLVLTLSLLLAEVCKMATAMLMLSVVRLSNFGYPRKPIAQMSQSSSSNYTLPQAMCSWYSLPSQASFFLTPNKVASLHARGTSIMQQATLYLQFQVKSMSILCNLVLFTLPSLLSEKVIMKWGLVCLWLLTSRLYVELDQLFRGINVLMGL